MTTPVVKITLEDCGQDFLEWYVRDNLVIDCQPCQGMIWVGSKVKMEGDRINVLTRFADKYQPLQYRAVELVTLERDEAREVEGYGRKWAEMLELAPTALGLPEESAA